MKEITLKVLIERGGRNMSEKELLKKLENIKNELKEIIVDESIVEFTNRKFDDNITNSARLIREAIKIIKG